MTRSLLLGFLIGIVTASIASCKSSAQQVERGEEWTYTSCWTNECIKTTLNGLSRQSAAEAKLTTWDDHTFVWYRKSS